LSPSAPIRYTAGVANRVSMLALAALLGAAGSARADVAAVPCPGDCGLDGVVGVDDLVKAVAAALGGSRPIACHADLDADGALTIGELVRLVGLALTGCPPLLEPGVYDFDARSDIDPSGGFNKSGILVVDPAHGAVSGELDFGVLESYALGFAAQSDGSLRFAGSGVTGGDIVVSVNGTARLTPHDDVLELRGGLDLDLFLGGAHLDFVASRPRAGTAAAYGGTYAVMLQHPQSSPSRIELPVDVPPSGIATCGATQDRSLDGQVLAELPAVHCLLSASGRFSYLTTYDAAGADDLALQVSGVLSAGAGAVTHGVYYIASFPLVDDSGAWQAEHLP
jgi:hypothetical protein